MKKFGRKNIISIVLVLLLGISGFLNWHYNNGQKDKKDSAKILGEAAYVNSNVKVDDYKDTFYEEKLQKEKARDESCEMLKDIINNSNSTSDGKKDAQNRIIEITRHKEQEADSEAILKSKGFKEIMVTVSGDGATVSFKGENLLPAQIAQIKDVIVSETKLESDKIKISASR